jgi:hypothetical protein
MTDGGRLIGASFRQYIPVEEEPAVVLTNWTTVDMDGDTFLVGQRENAAPYSWRVSTGIVDWPEPGRIAVTESGRRYTLAGERRAALTEEAAAAFILTATSWGSGQEAIRQALEAHSRAREDRTP